MSSEKPDKKSQSLEAIELKTLGPSLPPFEPGPEISDEDLLEAQLEEDRQKLGLERAAKREPAMRAASGLSEKQLDEANSKDADSRREVLKNFYNTLKRAKVALPVNYERFLREFDSLYPGHAESLLGKLPVLNMWDESYFPSNQIMKLSKDTFEQLKDLTVLLDAGVNLKWHPEDKVSIEKFKQELAKRDAHEKKLGIDKNSLKRKNGPSAIAMLIVSMILPTILIFFHMAIFLKLALFVFTTISLIFAVAALNPEPPISSLLGMELDDKKTLLPSQQAQLEKLSTLTKAFAENEVEMMTYRRTGDQLGGSVGKVMPHDEPQKQEVAEMEQQGERKSLPSLQHPLVDEEVAHPTFPSPPTI